MSNNKKPKSQKSLMLELIYRFRKWNKEWDDYPKKNIKQPMSVDEFAKSLESDFKVEKR
jgi:hypothetical protein